MKYELLAPAGNLEKAFIALRYGADAVYVGGKKFSLRARASNFEIEDIRELCAFAKSLNKRVYVTMNIIPHDSDFDGLEEYLLDLNDCGVDAIIVSSPYIIEKAKELVPNIEIHISTQTSITNVNTINYYASLGAKRVVLAREVTLEEMKLIKSKTKMPLEVFIHGGMCVSYSGRCVLSNHMTLRDANRGGCAHSCRWNYTLNDGSDLEKFYNMGSKDLMAIDYIPYLIDLGIESFKIEGRMKSSYYLATVVRAYRMVIDCYLKNGKITEAKLDEFKQEIKKAENRQTYIGFYNGLPGVCGHLYDNRSEIPTKEYVGYVMDYNEETKIALIEQRNYFTPGATLEFFGPNLANTTYQIDKIISHDDKIELDAARHPLQLLEIYVPFKLSKHDMVRLKN